jgi:hypothetical protein
MVAKAMIPQQGGTAATWMGTSLFFQCALLSGYAGAYALLRRSLRAQLIAWSVLLAASLATLSLPPRDLGQSGVAGTLLSLGVSLTPAALLLFATSILLQGWQLRHQMQVPYGLYAASNLGSLAGLVLYPFLIEPHVGLNAQFTAWRAGLILLALCHASLVALLLRTPGREPDPTANAASEQITTRRDLLVWTGLSALPCVAMLGTAQLLSAEIGSNPIAWVLPLGIYLASFALTFSGWWRPIATQAAAIGCVVGWVGFTLTKGLEQQPLQGWSLNWLMLALLGTCLAAHGWVYARRPSQEFSKFYLSIALGGALGGVFANVLVPDLIGRPDEAWWAMGLLAALFCASVAQAKPMARVLAAAPVLALLIASSLFPDPPADGVKIHHRRNVYGSVTIDMRRDRIALAHETTLHGVQLIASPEARRIPTTYYTPSSGLGVMIKHLQATRPALRVGVIGLGTGTIAAYARAEDRFVFWDVDPKVTWLADNVFSFLKDAPGKCEVRLADGRKGLAEAEEDFDLIIVDAFSGDAIPPHLLTREALDLYRRKTARRDGVVLLHVSNRFADLQPVVTATAAGLGLEVLRVDNEVIKLTPEGDSLATPTRYLIMHPPEHRAAVDKLFVDSDDTRSRLKRHVSRLKTFTPDTPVWTDDRHAITDALDFSLFFTNSKQAP